MHNIKTMDKETRQLINEPITPFLCPQQLANLCCNNIDFGLKSANQRSIMKRYRFHLQAILEENHITLFNLHLINDTEFSELITKRTHSKSVQWPSKMWMRSLQKTIKSLSSSLKWQLIINAIRHEMDHSIAKTVRSVIPDLGDLNGKSGSKLIDLITNNTKRTLTDSEAQYLRSLIKRATAKITLNIPDPKS